MQKVILVVDDESEIRTALRMSLQNEGHEVLELPDGRSAVQRCKEQHVDLVITDLLMPEKEGLETIKALRTYDPTIKIIAMSGGGRTAMFNMLQIAKAFGAQRILAKPFTNQELLEAVHAVLETEYK